MANIKVSEMSEATVFDDGDYAMIVQANQNKKISKENIFSNLENEISTNASDISTINTNIGDLTNLETQDTTNIVNGINSIIDAEIYSENEVKTNKIWIDGKPIYRKVINFGVLPNQSMKLVNINVDDFDKLITLNGLAHNPIENNYFPLPTVSSGGTQFMIDLAFISSEIRIRTLTDRSNMTAYIIIEYTKTTD